MKKFRVKFYTTNGTGHEVIIEANGALEAQRLAQLQYPDARVQHPTEVR